MALNTAALVPSATSYSPLKKKKEDKTKTEKLIRYLRLRRIYFKVHKEKIHRTLSSVISFSPMKKEAYSCSFIKSKKGFQTRKILAKRT